MVFGGRRWELALAAFAVALVASGVLHRFWFGQSPTTDPRLSVDLLLTTGPAAVLLYVARDFRERVPPDLAGRVVAWTGAGVIGIALLSVLAVLTGSSRGVRIDELVTSVQLTAGIGAVLGLFIGLNEAHAVERTRHAERASREAAVAQRERDTIDFLNDLVRHHFLNGTNAIMGYAKVLEQRVDDEERDLLSVIRRRAATMTTLVNEVTLLTQAADLGEPEVVDLAATVRNELGDRDSTTVEVILADPGPIRVRADALLGEAVSRLVDWCPGTDTATGDESDGTVVRASVDVDGDEAILRLGIDRSLPASIRDAPFDPSWGEIGLRLYLAKTLVGRHGTLEVASADEETTVFVVRFVRIEADGVSTDSTGIRTVIGSSEVA